MPLDLSTFLENLQKLSPNAQNRRFLVAVSGGVDSMVLLTLFDQANLDFSVAHINYGLRGKNSDADEELVRKYCSTKNLKLFVYRARSEDRRPKNSIQLWARNLRYSYFFNVMAEEKLDFLVTAHHLNDQLETFFINLFRGSGIKGLSGIPANENHVLRPLLNFSKEQIYAFAKENGTEFREDESNTKNDYLRNEFRNRIIPEIEKISPNFLNQFSSTVQYLHSANRYIQDEIAAIFSELILEENSEHFLLDKQKLLQQKMFIKTEIIRKLGFSGAEIQKVLHAENGKFFRSKSHEIRVHAQQIICRPKT